MERTRAKGFGRQRAMILTHLLLSDVTAVETADSKAGADRYHSSTKPLAHCLPNIVFDVGPSLLDRGL
jgi:hypothetical protein